MLKEFFNRGGFNIYPWIFADECLTKDIADIFGRKISKVIHEFDNGFLHYYGDSEEFAKIGEYLLQRVKTDRGFYDLVERNILLTGDDLMKFCENLKGINLEKLLNKELFDLYTSYAKKLKLVRAWGWVPPLMDGVEVYFLSDYIQEKLREYLKGIGQEGKTPEYYSVLSSSEKMSEVQIEEIERLKLILEIEKENQHLVEMLKGGVGEFLKEAERSFPEILEKVKVHAEKFEWLPYAYIGPGMTVEDAATLMNDSLSQKENIAEQIENIQNHYKEVKEKKKEIIEQIKLPEELIYLYDVSAFFMHLKDLRKGIYQKSYVAMDPIIEEISKRINLTVEETKFLTTEEVKEALINKKDFKKIAAERTKYCVAVVQDGQTKVYQGEPAKKIIAEVVTKETVDTNVKEFKGMVAYSGKVVGIVKIILVVEDIPKMQEGEILVSSATNPNLITAMKKAAAFVTDTGGITSHAAIVSREMKKPCIVGTKIATQVLKDGDKVEVDANSGIVKILERA